MSELLMVSIVIPTHNRVDILAAGLDSYLAQKCREVIVVDDASSDGTAGMLKGHPQYGKMLKVVTHDRRLGAPACRNSGAAVASGEYILFGEDDLIFGEDYADTLFRCARHKNADVIAGRLIYMLQGEEPQAALARADKKSGELLNSRLLIGNLYMPLADDLPFILLHACSLVRRSLWERLRYYEDYPVNGYREESDFYVRCARSGHSLYFCPHTACYHLPRESVTTGGQWRSSPWRYRYWAVRNNIKFLQRHYGWLKRELGLSGSMWVPALHHAFFESARALTYLLRHKWPKVYGLMVDGRSKH